MRTQLKFLIVSTLLLSLLAALIPSLQNILYFSSEGLEKFYVWQFFTYPFVEPGPLSFGFFLTLGFNLYILWMFGSALLERMHTVTFFSLYFGSAIVSALIALIFPHPVLAGSANPIFAILFTWMMLNPGTQLLLFFAIPFKAHWLVVSLLGITLSIQLTNADWIGASCMGASVLFAYLFSIIFFKEQSPFLFLRPLERKILRLFEKKSSRPYQHSKVYDIKSGAPILNDEQFMDAMLERISRLGENSITPSEKKRMQEISDKKKH